MIALNNKLKQTGMLVVGLLLLLSAQAVSARGNAPAPEELDPLERSWPEIHNTRDGAPADWPEPARPGSYYFFQADRLELGFGDNEDTHVWDVQGWMGGDYHKFWFKSEGEGARGETLEEAEFQGLYSRVIAPFWDAQLGIRYDARPDTGLTHAVIGLQGLAPQWFEVDAAAFVSDRGDLTLRTELEYELLLTQRLILQPRFEINAAAGDVPERDLAAGLTDLELGLRLRYEIRREIAPYIGVSWSRKLGNTADIARSGGHSAGNTAVVAGIRFWF